LWTTEIYADQAAFTAHSASKTHAAATPIFAELIAQSEFMIGETLIAKGLDR
jgi:quinol monooxygenase YgiN